jgi:3'-5' exoribonuclease
MKISELGTGTQIITLVVMNATARKTKAQKDYLVIEFFDGIDSINGNYWDWQGKVMPEKNTILDVSCQLTEWQGTKQLNVKGMTVNKVEHISTFMPASNNSVGEVYKEAYSLASDIKNYTLRSLAIAALEQWQHDWLMVPGAKTIHHNYVGGTLIHSVSIAKLAKAMAQLVPGANEDLCVAGGLLHDIGKLQAYKLSGVTIDMTHIGMLMDHSSLGIEMITNVSTLVPNCDQNASNLLKHIIISHHGIMEHGASVTPVCIEAYIVHHADALDAEAEQIRAMCKNDTGAAWTDRVWALNNKPHLTPRYINEVLDCEVDHYVYVETLEDQDTTLPFDL